MKLFSEHLNNEFSVEPLNEAQQKYDIKSKYDYYNKTLFNGELPDNFKMRFSRTKKAGGHVRTMYWTKGRGRYQTFTRWEIEELMLSTFFLRTEEQLDSILVHEMIHVWLTANEMHEGYNVKLHGPEFVQKMGELQSKVPFQISLYHTQDQRGDLSTRSKSLEVGVLVTLVNGKADSIAVFTKKTLEDNLERLKEIMNKNAEPGLEIIFGLSSHPTLETFKIKRSVSRFSLYHYNDKQWDNLQKDFTELERISASGEVSPAKIQKRLNDELFSATMKLMASKPGSKKQEELKVQVNTLRKKLNMEPMEFSK